MQSCYGASEIQHFMVDGSVHSTLFSATHPNQSAASHTVPGGGGGEEAHQSATSATNSFKLINPFHHHHHHHHHHKAPPAPAPMDFLHFHSIPTTQQLFTRVPHPHHHQFQLFHNNPDNYDQHRRLQQTPPLLDHGPDPENHSATGGTMPSFLAADVNFKLAVDDSSGSGSKDGLNNDSNIAGGILHGDNASESRLRLWQREEDCGIKEPFWRPLDLDCINRSNKRRKDKELDQHHFAKRFQEADDSLENSQPPASVSNYKLFSELEAIYRPGNITSTSGGRAYAANQTTGSGSALTGDEPVMPTAAAGAPEYRVDDNNSTGCEEHQHIKKIHQHSRHRSQRKKLKKESITVFFEGLVKQLVDHQELLHQKFIDTLEQRDGERSAREEAWREQEATRAMREAAVRARDRALAAAREAAIVSFLEKISGETLNLPSHPQDAIVPSAFMTDEKLRDNSEGGIATTLMRTSRWPKAEVQALISVRSGLEGRFLEPGLKGPLWEEVSAAMSTIGYHRGAKRCKEKWENINKYFRKAKYSGKNRPQQSKTCPYFQQLDQLYSKPLPPFQHPPLPDTPNKNADLLHSAAENGGFTDGEEEFGESEGRRTHEMEEEETDQPGLSFTESLQ